MDGWMEGSGGGLADAERPVKKMWKDLLDAAEFDRYAAPMV